MFTGIIEDIGKVVSAGRSRLGISTSLGQIVEGDSVSVSGACLTAVKITESRGMYLVEFDFSPETADRTTAGGLSAGDMVNLERALEAGKRLGGHFLSGHVDAVITLKSVHKEGNSRLYSFSLPGHLRRFVAEKGSVAVDGISLTVASVTPGSFTASVIPFTLDRTTLKDARPGDAVNFETDIMAKYAQNGSRGLTAEFLRENGFA